MAYWYNTRTGQVEDGPRSLGVDRLAPFATADEAARALQIVEERARQWAREDAVEEQQGPSSPPADS